MIVTTSKLSSVPERPPSNNCASVRGSEANGVQTLEWIDTLNARDDIEYAEPNYIAHAFATPNDSLLSQQWDVAAMNSHEYSAAEKTFIQLIETYPTFAEGWNFGPSDASQATVEALARLLTRCWWGADRSELVEDEIRPNARSPES